MQSSTIKLEDLKKTPEKYLPDLKKWVKLLEDSDPKGWSEKYKGPITKKIKSIIPCFITLYIRHSHNRPNKKT